MLKHILSAVQNSVEKAALDAARAVQVTTGGWMPAGFRQRQPPDRRTMELCAKELRACGIRELPRRAGDFARADQYNVLAADLTVVVNCAGAAPSSFAKSRRDRVLEFCRSERVGSLQILLRPEDISRVVERVNAESVESLLVISVQEQPDDEELGDAAMSFFQAVLGQLSVEKDAKPPCLDASENRDARRYPVYSFLVTHRQRLLERVLGQAQETVREALDQFELAREVRDGVRDATLREVEGGIKQLGEGSFREFLNMDRFFAGQCHVGRARLDPTAIQDLFQLCVVRATCHELSNPRWWLGASPNLEVHECNKQSLLSAQGIIKNRLPRGKGKPIPQRDGTLPDTGERPGEVDEDGRKRDSIFTQACQIIAATDLRSERGLRTYLMLVLGGLDSKSECGRVVNGFAQRVFKVQSTTFLSRFRRLCPDTWRRWSRKTDPRNQDDEEKQAATLWKQFKKQGKMFRGSLDSGLVRPISCSKPGCRPSDREDDLYYFADEFPFVRAYWTPGRLAGFCRELCELNGDDNQRWARWLASDA